MSDIKFSVGILDNATDPLKRMAAGADALESKLHGVNEVGKELLNVLGAGFAAYKIGEFVKDGMEEMKGLNIQVAILNQQLKNSGKFSDEMAKSLQEGRENLSKLGFLNDVDVAKFQNSLIKAFSNANEAFRDQFSQTAANMANDGDIVSAGQKLAGILSLKPTEKGYKENLKRIFAEFGPTEFENNRKAIEKAASPGHDYATEMLRIVQNLASVKDMAKARAEADPEFALKQRMDALGDHVGTLALKLQKALLPSVEKVVGMLDNIVTRHSDAIIGGFKAMSAVAGLFVAKKVYEMFVGFVEGFKKVYESIFGVTRMAAQAQELTAMEALTVSAWGAAEALGVIAGEGAVGGAAGVLGGAGEIGAVGGLGSLLEAGTLASIVAPVLATTAIIGAVAYLVNDSLPRNQKRLADTHGNKPGFYAPNFVTDSNSVTKAGQFGGFNWDGSPVKPGGNIYGKKAIFKDIDMHDVQTGYNGITPITDALGKKAPIVQQLQTLNKQLSKANSGKASSGLDLSASLAAKDAKVNGQNNRQFIININGGLVNKLENHYEGGNSARTKTDIERAIIEGITEALNALPGYAQ